MGIFDPDEVITQYSLKEAIGDGVLVEIFKNKWNTLSRGKPIVATANLIEGTSLVQLCEIWNEYVVWRREVMLSLPEEERLFAAKVNNRPVWVIEDAVSCTLMYPADY